MQIKKRHPWIVLASILIFFITFMIHYTDAIDISIKNASPMLMLPLLTAFSMFSQPVPAAAAGLITGILTDSAAAGTLCFNSVAMMLFAAFTAAMSNNLFNRNIRSALLLSVLTSLVYFLLRWLFFYAFITNIEDNITYLLSYAFPSIIYTNIFIFPYYFIFRYFYRRVNA